MARFRLFALFVAVLAPAALIMAATAAAQTATPAPVQCTTAPRTDADLAQLGATPAASPTPTPQLALPAAGGVDKATANGLQTLLDQLTACQTAGKVNAVLALYTDAYVANVALAPESVAIVPGTPSASAPALSSPTSNASPALALVEARTDADGRIVALVMYGPTPHVFVFAQENGVWKIDQTAGLAPPLTGGSDDLSYPAPILAARAAAAKELNVASSKLTIFAIEQETWPDSSLGCPQPGMFYAQVITPGFLTLIGTSTRTLEYHTDAASHAQLCRTYGD